MATFQHFYRASRGSIFKTKEGIEFPVFTDGAAVRQGVGVVIAYLLSGTGLDGFIGHSQLSKGWINGLHVSGGEPSLSDELVTVLGFLKKHGLKLQLDTNGKNATGLKTLLQERLGDRVVMDIKCPLALYEKVIGEAIDPGEIKNTISLVPQFPDYEFQTTIVPVVRQEGSQPEISYITPVEIGETAKLIKKVTGSRQQPYLLRLFDPNNSSHEKMKNIEKLANNEMFKYRTAAREHLSRTEIEKI